jgi:tyrosine-protein kinase Etk/Wzc
MNNNELFPLESEQPQAKDLKRILQQYSRFWYLFVLGASIGLGLAFLYLKYYAVPQYMTYGTMLIKDDKSGQNLSNADAFADLSTFKSSRNIDNEIEILKSASIMDRVVKELDLFTSYYVEGKIIDKEIYGEGLSIKVVRNSIDSTAAGRSFIIYLKSGNSFDLKDETGAVSSHSFGQQIKMPYGSFTITGKSSSAAVGKKIIVRFQNIHQVADHYNKAVSVLPVSKGASVLNITLVDPIAERAKNVVNKLMDVYNKEAVEDKKLVGVSTLKFLDDRLSFLTNELSSVEKGVERYKSSNGLTDITTQATDFTSQATDYNKQLSEWAIQIDVLESLEAYLKKNSGQYSMVPSTLGIQDATLVTLIGKFNELQAERERRLQTTAPTSVLIQNINEQLANLQANILENLRNIKGGLQITSNNLKKTSGQFQSRIRSVPGMERELLEIKRQQSIKQNIYAYLLQKREETALSLAATTSVARVLDYAKGGDYPISPNRQMIYLIALLTGLALPFAAISLANMLNNKVQTQQDVTSVVGAPIIGEIAHNSKKESIVVTRGNRSPIAEMFQLVRTNLHFAVAGLDKVVLLMTSSTSGEGKTFLSINIAASLVATGKRVIILDLDLREPKIAANLGLPAERGMADYLVSDSMLISEIIRPVEKVPGLFAITAGPVPHNPAELIMSPKFSNLIQELKEDFDYIIIDSAPVGLVSDAYTLSTLADLTVYVVRYNYTFKAQLNILKNSLKNKTLTRPVVLLNDAKEANGGTYGYGYGYGYDKKGTGTKKLVG